MTQPIELSGRTKLSRDGFTLVELLVVISIMAALTALMLPRLRTVNQDRGIREAARVVGSKFAEASDRARRDGKAAVTLLRNSNMLDVDGVNYASSTIFLSRAVPNYIGDSVGVGAFKQTRIQGGVTHEDVVRIARPLEQTNVNNSQQDIIRVGDLIRVSTSLQVSTPVAYRVLALDPPGVGTTRIVPDELDIQLEILDTQPGIPGVPENTSGVPPATPLYFVVERQPKILRSSITDLPPGYIVDLRLSGPVVQMETGTGGPGEISAIAAPPAPRVGNPVRPVFYELMRPALASAPDASALASRLSDQYSRIDIFFDSTGGISSVRTYRGNWDVNGSIGLDSAEPITGPLQLFIAPTELEAGSSPLYDDANLWVTISNASGGVNIGYNNPPIALAGTPTLAQLVTEARKSARSGVSASQ